MVWDYRVTKQVVDGETAHHIREFYYDGGDIVGWTRDPMYAQGETAEGLRADLDRMISAFDYPVIDLDELEPDPYKA